jgi:hypothetical protein
VIEAIVGMLEIHWSCGEFVTSWIRPELPNVASAMYRPDSPDSASVCEPGTMESEVTAWDAAPPLVTVKVAVPVATDLSGFVAIAVIVDVPWFNAVASPVVAAVHGAAAPMIQIDATFAELELQATWLVIFSVDPEEVVPIAMN